VCSIIVILDLNLRKRKKVNKISFAAEGWLKEKSRKQFSFAGPQAINTLPDSIKQKIVSSKKHKLKKELKEFLFERLVSMATATN